MVRKATCMEACSGRVDSNLSISLQATMGIVSNFYIKYAGKNLFDNQSVWLRKAVTLMKATQYSVDSSCENYDIWG